MNSADDRRMPRVRRAFSAPPSLENAMIVLILKISILSLAIGLGTSPATAGEGSADIGPQPPYGYFGNEGGRSPRGAYGRPVAYGSPDARPGGTMEQRWSRR